MKTYRAFVRKGVEKRFHPLTYQFAKENIFGGRTLVGTNVNYYDTLPSFLMCQHGFSFHDCKFYHFIIKGKDRNTYFIRYYEL